MTRGQKIAAAGAGTVGTAAVAAGLLIPGVNLVVAPVVGAVTVAKALGVLAVFLAGWAKTSPGHAAQDALKAAIAKDKR